MLGFLLCTSTTEAFLLVLFELNTTTISSRPMATRPPIEAAEAEVGVCRALLGERHSRRWWVETIMNNVNATPPLPWYIGLPMTWWWEW